MELQVCAYHNSSAAVICAKWWLDWIFKIKKYKNFHKTSTMRSHGVREIYIFFSCFSNHLRWPAFPSIPLWVGSVRQRHQHPQLWNHHVRTRPSPQCHSYVATWIGAVLPEIHRGLWYSCVGYVGLKYTEIWSRCSSVVQHINIKKFCRSSHTKISVEIQCWYLGKCSFARNSDTKHLHALII